MVVALASFSSCYISSSNFLISGFLYWMSTSSTHLFAEVAVLHTVFTSLAFCGNRKFNYFF